MKLNFSFLFFFILTKCLLSQAPEIEWQNTLGGTGTEWMGSILQTVEGGYLLGTSSSSEISFDKTIASQGFVDIWLVKLDTFGIIEWQRVIGGLDADQLTCMDQTTDGGYILGGTSDSNISGDKTENSKGGIDYWVIKIDSEGTIEWQKTIGGINTDILLCIEQTSDNGYILGGYSDSYISGNKTVTTNGGDDFWVVKIDSVGNIEWQRGFGNEYNDLFTALHQTSDGGYILGGTKDGIVSDDYWVIKLNIAGNSEWQKTIKGNEVDVLTGIEQIADNGYIICGGSTSGIGADKTVPCLGDWDFWILKLNEDGDIIWQKTIGGSLSDYQPSLKLTTDGGFILGGDSMSNISGNKTENCRGGTDYWIVKCDAGGNVEWDKTIGGSDLDYFQHIIQCSEGEYVFGGFSISPMSGDKNENCLGEPDIWMGKLACPFPNYYYQDMDADGFGDPLSEMHSCYILPGYILNNTDCDDANAMIFPDGIEICNGLDDDCNAEIDNGFTMHVFFMDGDEDGFGDPELDTLSCAESILGFLSDSSDCNDADILIFPEAPEICNLLDDNCNAEIDEGLLLNYFYADNDGDSFGNILIDSISCFDFISGYVIDSSDCDDSDATIYPGAPEIEDGLDNNCNDTIDEGFTSIDILNANNYLKIFPNPAHDYLTIEINFKRRPNSGFEIEIFNILGESLISIPVLPNVGSEISRIDISELNAGLYLISVKTGVQNFVQNFIVE